MTRGDAAVQADAVTDGRRDSETRERLLQAAARLFADARLQEGHGPRHLPRRARQRRRRQLPLRRQARALPRGAAGRRSTRCATTTDAARRGRRGQPPEEQLRRYIAHLPAPRCSTPGNDTDPPADPPRDERSDAGARHAGRAGRAAARRVPLRRDRANHRLRADGPARAALRRQRAGAVARVSAEPDRDAPRLRQQADAGEPATTSPITSRSSRWPASTPSATPCMPADRAPRQAHDGRGPEDPDVRLREATHPAGWVNPEPAGRYDLVVIGGGTAGPGQRDGRLRARRPRGARRARSAGRRLPEHRLRAVEGAAAIGARGGGRAAGAAARHRHRRHRS